jgi:hypothetical protein
MVPSTNRDLLTLKAFTGSEASIPIQRTGGAGELTYNPTLQALM